MYKMSLLINSNQGLACGWSETYYTSFTSISGATTKAQGLMGARRAILCKDFSIVAVRLTGDILAPPARTQILNQPGGLPGLLTPLEDYPNTAILFQLRGASSRALSKDLRGWPDDFVEAIVTNAVRLSPAGRTALDTFIAYLVSNSIGWRVNGRFGDPGVAGFRSTGVTTGLGASTSIAGTVPPAWATAHPTIVVNGFRSPISQLNGTYTGAGYTVSGGAVVLFKGVSSDYLAPYGTGGGVTVSEQTPAFIDPTSGTYVRTSSRKTGRPFGLLRGRRPNR